MNKRLRKRTGIREASEMNISLEARLIILLLYLACLHLGAIFFFTSGFLLTRTELSHFSDCGDVQSAPCHGTFSFISDISTIEDSMERDTNTSSKCWTEPAVKRAIIIIIDALRFDFIERSNISNNGRMPWMNKLKVLHELVDEESPSAAYFKFISDPPTTTLQRLKGLMTGGLPTFIDIGHSFGASAILEDNLIFQLKRMGKRVIMMGDDTWLQLFPDDLTEVYPFPSFNVKDLHTVDNGVIKELFPALHRDNWDVLIAHFLGVDHVGHIFGVNSPLMVEKLEQYNMVIEKVVSVLRELSEPGGPHEDTLLIIMGDHGQTLNGDHGGGTAEEVETALFALSMRKVGGFIPKRLRSSPCDLLSVDEVGHCVSTLPQLDFSPTVAALLGIPFPFGSVGRVNPELYALTTHSSRNFDLISEDQHEKDMVLTEWLERYAKVLCLNSWQVKRYFEVYEASALSKFPAEELSELNELYLKAQLLSDSLKEYRGFKQVAPRFKPYLQKRISILMDVILSFSSFLTAAGLLARSQWTQFGDGYMFVGIWTLIISIAVHGFALLQLFKLENNFKGPQAVLLLPIRRLVLTCIGSALAVIILVLAFHSPPKRLQTYPFTRLIASLKDEMHLTLLGVLLCSSSLSYLTISLQDHKRGGGQHVFFRWLKSKVADLENLAALFFVAGHAFSLLSNSFILAEGQVAAFFLASLGILYLRRAIQKRSKIYQAILFLCLNRGLSSMGLTGIIKDARMQFSMAKGVSDVPGLYGSWKRSTLLLFGSGQTFLPLMFLSWMLIQHTFRNHHALNGILLMPSIAVPAAYLLIVLHWLVLDHAATLYIDTAGPIYECARLYLPRMVYMTSIVLTLVTKIVTWRIAKQTAKLSKEEIVKGMVVALLAAFSPTVILLIGRKGPLIALVTFFIVRCIQDLQSFKQQEQDIVMEISSIPVIGWNFLAILQFFCTSHRCTFDGLRYPAAFIGFDDFQFFRQGTLLAIDTFGVSHLLPIFGLPLIINISSSKSDFSQSTTFTLQIGKAFLAFGMMRAITATFVTICAALQRRHLMVWGLFAPKYVFDALGLLVTDFLLVIAAIVYLYPR